MKKEIVISGGGIIGLCSAYYLQKAGHKVTVIDKGNMDAGASFVNAGYLTPSHIISLAAPGVITKGIKWMFNSSSPFYMKPRLDPEFLRWAWYFHRSATAEKVRTSIPVIRDINLMSKDLYEGLLKSGDLGEFQLEKKGLLMLYKTQKAEEDEMAVAEQARDMGLIANNLDRKELIALEPGIADSVRGAVHYLDDAHTTPGEIMEKLKTYLKAQGVTLICGESIREIETSGGSVTALKGDQGTYKGDFFVLSSGAWTGAMVKKLGIHLPLQAGKGYRIDIDRSLPITLPAVLCEKKVAITPMNGFTRLAGTMEFSGINHHIRPERVKAIARATEGYYKDLSVTDTELSNAQCGLRPVSPDGLPYIGKPAGWNNLAIATGHAMMGWSLGPATGKLISELVDELPSSLDLTPFQPNRKF